MLQARKTPREAGLCFGETIAAVAGAILSETHRIGKRNPWGHGRYRFALGFEGDRGMGAPVYMAWYPKDYLGDTTHLTRDQHGGYTLLLWAMWMAGGRLRDDDAELMLIAKCSQLDEWRKLREKLAPFFQIHRGFWRHKRVDVELRKAERKQQGHSLGARLTNAKRSAHRTLSGTPSASLGAGEPDSDSERKEEASLWSAEKKVARLDGEPASLKSPHQETKNGAGRGTRLPLDWQPDDEDRRYAEERGLKPDEVAECFRDFWAAKVGTTAKKLDWHATWRTWCRNEATARYRRGLGSQGSSGDRPGTASFTAALRRAFPDVN